MSPPVRQRSREDSERKHLVKISTEESDFDQLPPSSPETRRVERLNSDDAGNLASASLQKKNTSIEGEIKSLSRGLGGAKLKGLSSNAGMRLVK